MLETVREALRAHAFRFTDEAELQDGIAQVLTAKGIAFEAEVILSPLDRIDFLVDSGLGIEVKIGGSISALTRQVARYMQRPEVTALIVVTSRLRLTNLPEQLCGKPIRTLPILGAFE